MNTPSQPGRKWNQRGNPAAPVPASSEARFRLFFERSADPIWLLDPRAGVFVDCNEAAVVLMRAGSREVLLGAGPAEFSPPLQPDGRSSREAAAEIVTRVHRHGGHRFEWLARRCDGTEIPLEVVATAIDTGTQHLHVVVSRDMSQRKQADEQIRQLNQSLERRIAERTAALSASEARARILVEHAPEAIVVFDGDTGQFVSGNENACRLYGLSWEELATRTPADVSPEYQRNRRKSVELAREMVLRALAGETPVFEWLHRHASGRIVPCEVRLVCLPTQGRNLVRASITNTTERRRRELIQQAIYHISEAVHTATDLDGFYAEIHTTIIGLMPAQNFYIALYDRAAQTLSFVYHVDELTEKPQPLRLNTGLTSYVLRAGKPLLMDRAMNARKKQVGSAVTFEGYEEISYIESGVPAAIWLGVPLTTQGKVIGVMAVQDYHNELAYGEEEKQILTFIAGQIALAIERKRAEQALRESEEKFRALFEASSQGVMLHDADRVLEVNPASVRILGFDQAAEIVGRHPADLAVPLQPNGERAEVMAHRHIEACMSGGSARFEWLCHNPRGEEVPLEVILTRVPMGGRQIIQALILDIRERKKAETELLKALERERELSALRTNFVSLVSHEFRTPLGIILSSAEILQDYLDQLDPGERRQHLESIRKSTQRMAGLMEEILFLARFDAGKMDFQPATLDLPGCCRRLVDEVSSATHRVCPIELAVPPSLPLAQADERLWQHILTNLLANAVKYSSPGRSVQVSLARDGVDVICRIRDHGIGIPGPDLPWLFNAFHRGRNVGSRPGTGLGLVIVKRCVELHGGKIKVESQLNKGTTMTVRLPVFR